jgi:DnaJ-class molecular chaperone
MHMNHTHPDAFLDVEKYEPFVELGLTKECPKCQGHGVWNLAISQYPRAGQRYRHFQQVCDTCSGYGYVSPEDNLSAEK